MARGLSIGRVARATGCKVQTIRYYEGIGLLPQPHRTNGNQRQYDESAIGRLSFIRHARELGFSLEAIRDLLALSDDPDNSCADVDRVAQRHLDQVESRIARLQSLQRELKRMLTQCRGGKVATCKVIDVLSDHSLCVSDDHREGPSL